LQSNPSTLDGFLVNCLYETLCLQLVAIEVDTLLCPPFEEDDFFLWPQLDFCLRFISSFLWDFFTILLELLAREGLSLQLVMKLLYFTTEEVSDGLLLINDPLILDVEYDEFLRIWFWLVVFLLEVRGDLAAENTKEEDPLIELKFDFVFLLSVLQLTVDVSLLALTNESIIHERILFM
jgi:hypothetical protein